MAACASRVYVETLPSAESGCFHIAYGRYHYAFWPKGGPNELVKFKFLICEPRDGSAYFSPHGSKYNLAIFSVTLGYTRSQAIVPTNETEPRWEQRKDNLLGLIRRLRTTQFVFGAKRPCVSWVVKMSWTTACMCTLSTTNKEN